MGNFADFCRVETKSVRDWFHSHGFHFVITEKHMQVFSCNLTYGSEVVSQFSVYTTDHSLEIIGVSSTIISETPTVQKKWTIEKKNDVIRISCELTIFGQKSHLVASKAQKQEKITLSDLGHGW
jgi:hypothetical protein